MPCLVWPPRTSAIDLCPVCSVSVRYVAVLFPRAKVPLPWNRTGHVEQARIDLCPPSVFFSTTPICLGLKDKNEKGVGVLRFNGAAWETGWHFCPRDSLNVIINQPTSLFFEAHRVTATLNGGKHTRRREKGCGALFALGETVLLTG